MIEIGISLALFFLAALFEIGGGYLVWLWLKENDSFTYQIMDKYKEYSTAKVTISFKCSSTSSSSSSTSSGT